MGNSGDAVTEPVPPEPHIINIVSSTRLELDKTRKDARRRDDSNRNTKISMSNVELKEGETVETADLGSNMQLAGYPLTVEGKVAMSGVAEREERRKGKERMKWKVIEC